MGNYAEMIVQGGPVVWTILVLVLLIFAAIAIRYFKKRKREPEMPVIIKKQPKIDVLAEEKKLVALADYRLRHGDKASKVLEEFMNQEVIGQTEQLAIRIDEGPFKCLAFLPGNISRWTAITEPVGELYQADPSCPLSGGIYIVKQLISGEVVDYDPREVPIITEEMPEIAWFATHWSIVKRVFALPTPWYKSTALWFAVGMMLIVFIVALVVAGG